MYLSPTLARNNHLTCDKNEVMPRRSRDVTEFVLWSTSAASVSVPQVKSRLQVRLQELEPIPEMLRSTELQLQEATAKLHSHEARSKESNLLLEELTTKVCTVARHHHLVSSQAQTCLLQRSKFRRFFRGFLNLF